MGRINYPIYGEDLGSTIQDVEKIIAKIKTNKYSTKDLLALADANNSVIKFIIENANKD